jgi:hypothetical protein
VTIGYLEIAISARKEETTTGQVVLEPFFGSSGIVHVEFIPEEMTEAPLQGDPSLSMQFSTLYVSRALA